MKLFFPKVIDKRNTGGLHRSLVATSALLFCFLIVPGLAHAVTLGDANDFAILIWGGTKESQLSISHEKSGADGNVGLGGNAKANFSSGFITGTYYVDPNAKNTGDVTKIKTEQGGSTHIAAVSQSLSDAVADAISYSSNFAGFTSTMTYNTKLTGATHISSAGGTNVVDFYGLDFTGDGDILTISGGSSDSFIFNVRDGATFKFTHKNSGIRLEGGITEENVIFNFLGTGGAISFSGGPTVYGRFLAIDREIKVSPGTIFGSLISGRSISMPSGGNATFENGVIEVPEPSTLLLLGSGLAGLAVFGRRRKKT